MWESVIKELLTNPHFPKQEKVKGVRSAGDDEAYQMGIQRA